MTKIAKKKSKEYKDFFKKIFRLIKQRVKETELSNSAIIIAYYLLLSLFPLLIVLGNLLPYFSFEVDNVMDYLSVMIPGNIFLSIESTLRNLLTSSNNRLLSFGVLTALWSSSKGIYALQTAMNKAYGVYGKLSFFIVRIVSLLFTLLLVFTTLFVLLIFSFGQQIVRFSIENLGINASASTLFAYARWPLTLLLLMIIFVLIYYIVPNVGFHFKSVIPGALFATAGWVILSQGFTFYVAQFARQTISYGSIGIFIVLMIWLYLGGYVITLGAVINAVIFEYRNGAAQESGKIERIVSHTIKKGKGIIHSQRKKQT